MRIKPELLAPAGTMEKMKMAVLYGADAVYMGGPSFGLRAMGGNFTKDELREAVAFCHDKGKKAYVTVNIYAHNSDLEALPDYMKFLYEIGADAALVADLGVFSIAREAAPKLPLHVSTQANNTNWRTVQAWAAMGAERVVLARELSLNEIREIREHTDVELEMFVHGAMCMSYSGRCLVSNYLTGRDANRGTCAQACRWKYSLVEETRPGQYFPVEEDERGTYFFNSKDLCLMPYLKDLIDAGVNSLKIEGRMKSVHYAASVTKAYREAIDSCWENPEAYEVKQEWSDELNKVSHRAYTTGFLFGRPGAEGQIYGSSSYEQTSDFVGLVLSYDDESKRAKVEQRNHMELGEEIEIFQPKAKGFRQILSDMLDEEGKPISAAPHPQQIIYIKMEQPVEPYTILRRDVKS